MATYEAVIGLEIHAELNTKTKMFCFSPNDPDEKHPNINICPICMGHPGTLPTINQEAVKKVIAVGIALGGAIPEYSQFDRKNYFYPDLPKGYQISQYKHPLVNGGELEIFERQPYRLKQDRRKKNHNLVGQEWLEFIPRRKKIRITRIHLEEDTGRLTHDKESGSSLVDFNRAGVPLMELVTEPDFRTGEEIIAFGEELQRIVRYVGASDADMEKGQMRVEVNISLRPAGQEKFGTKVEVKNINSFKYAADAAAYEIKRQTALLEAGEKIAQETRGWNEHTQETFAQRAKESAHDYRYFPEPDLPPLRFSPEFIDEMRRAAPELPAAKRERFSREYGLAPDMIETLVRDRALADYFEAAASEAAQHDKETSEKPRAPVAKIVAAFITGDILRLLRETSSPISDIRITPENLAELAVLATKEKISSSTAKQILGEMFASGNDPSDIAERLGLWQMSDTADLESIASHIIKENPKAVEDYRRGKMASVQFLVGQMMKESRGTANPKIAQEIIKKILGVDG